MNKIWIIIKREAITRLRKRSFILMGILGPVLFAGLFLAPSLMMSYQSQEVRRVAVIDSSRVFIDKIPETKYLKFDYLAHTSIDEVRGKFDELPYDAVLYIGHIVHYSPNAIQIMGYKQPDMGLVMHVTNALEKEIEKQKMEAYDIQQLDHILKSVETKIQLRTIKWSRDGKDRESRAGIAMAVSYMSGFLIYLLIFLFGAMVMRGVIEEKTNRIVEVIVSSVKPWQFMMGKILGIAIVGLTQFLMWIILTIAIISLVQQRVQPDMAEIDARQQKEQGQSIMSGDVHQNDQQEENSSSFFKDDQPVVDEELIEVRNFLKAAQGIDLFVMIGSFLLFFLGGYLLYAAMFAAVGSMVDNDTDTQQFMLPVTIPLIIALMIMITAIRNPDNDMVTVFSMIPLTSPIIMMARIPFGVSYSHIIISLLLLYATFLLVTWLAARIYRTGILMYGKKINLRVIGAWIIRPFRENDSG